MKKRQSKYELANSLVEYAFILGVVVLALSMMNIYVKRGFQGRVKDMTDYFIGGGREVQDIATDPKYTNTTSESESNYLTTIKKTKETDGGTKITVLDIPASQEPYLFASSRTEDKWQPINPDSGDFIPAEAGNTLVQTSALKTTLTESDFDNLRRLAENARASAQARRDAPGADAQTISESQRQIDEANQILAQLPALRQLMQNPLGGPTIGVGTDPASVNNVARQTRAALEALKNTVSGDASAVNEIQRQIDELNRLFPQTGE